MCDPEMEFKCSKSLHIVGIIMVVIGGFFCVVSCMWKSFIYDPYIAAAAAAPAARTTVRASTESTRGSPEKEGAKKNKCHICKKNVELTGITCRCDGLYCSDHRYSNEHQCTLDYHGYGAGEIRPLNNPVIQREKIQKI